MSKFISKYIRIGLPLAKQGSCVGIISYLFLLVFTVGCTKGGFSSQKLSDQAALGPQEVEPPNNPPLEAKTKVYRITDYEARPLIKDSEGKYYSSFVDYNKSEPLKYQYLYLYSDYAFLAIKDDILRNAYTDITILIPSGTYLLKDRWVLDFSKV